MDNQNLKQTNFKLQNLDQVYTRLLNKKIEHAQIKKVNSETKIIAQAKEAKSLNNRVLDITKLNKNLNILCTSTKISILEPKEFNQHISNLQIKTNNSVNKKETKSFFFPSILTTNPQNQNKLNSTAIKTNLSSNLSQSKSILGVNGKGSKVLDTKISKYLKTITQFEPEIAQYKNIVYNFNSNKKQFKLNSILENSFYSIKSLIGTPVYEITPNKIIINLFYYLKKRRNNFKNLNSRIKQLQHLLVNLSNKINKPIELDLVRLHHPTLDSQISANAIGIIANKLRKPFRVIASKFFRFSRIKNPTLIKNIFNKTNSNKLSFITGIRLKLGGRLITQKVIPRRSSKTIQKGNLNRCNTDIVTTSRFTAKSKRGAFSITVSMGHKFF